MTPTPKLRWVERDVLEPHPYKENTTWIKKLSILQQWWEDTSTDVYWVNGNPGEWRDVPVEEEK